MNTAPQQVDSQEVLRSTVEQLVAAMCQRPADCRVTLLPSERRPVVVVAVSQLDYGAVLGKYRSTLDALQLLTKVVGDRMDLEAELLLDQDATAALAPGEERRKPKPDKDWDSGPLEKLANLVLPLALGQCVVSVSNVSSTVSRMVVSVTDGVTSRFTGEQVSKLEAAADTVFNCVGACMGRNRIIVEVVA